MQLLKECIYSILTVFIFLNFLLSQNITHEKRKIPVAIMDFVSEELSNSSLLALTGYFRTELLKTDIYDIMERNNMDEIFKEQAFQLSGVCSDLECLVEAGQILGVHKMIGGAINKLGLKYIITLKIIDVETGRIDKIYTETFIGAEEELDQAILLIISRIKGSVIEKSTEFYVNSEPIGAAVYIENEFIGNSPIRIPIQEIKEYNIKIMAQGYQTWKQVRKPEKGGTVLIDATLIKEIVNLNQNDLTNANYINYLKKQKSYAKGAALSILPGGGHFYSEQYFVGTLFLLLRGATFATYFFEENIGHNEELNIIIVASLEIDVITSLISVYLYNKKIKGNYKISFQPVLNKDKHLLLGLNIEF